VGLGKALQQGCGFGKRHPTSEMRKVILEQWGEETWQQG
jgi:hypothetical protein